MTGLSEALAAPCFGGRFPRLAAQSPYLGGGVLDIDTETTARAHAVARYDQPKHRQDLPLNPHTYK